MANKYLDLTGLQDFATKLATKLHTIFATKADVGAPLVASTVAGMTDHDRIYVYTGSETGYTNGNWYYWDGTAWTSGGTYNSQAIGDGTITTAKLASGAVTAEKIASGAVVNSVNGETGAVTGVAMDDGYYENMTVGSADQLISSVNIEDKVPYVFRTSGGANDIGDREFDEIHGGTIAWNQLAQAGGGSANVCTKAYDSSTGVTAVTPNAYSSNAVGCYDLVPPADLQAHKYLCTIMVDTDNTGAFKFGFGSNSVIVSVASGAYREIASVFSWTVSSLTIYAQALASEWTSGGFRFKNVMCFDLTAMFGSTIADYIYSLEQANAGAGVAWFKSLFPKPYYAYNAGTLISVSGLSAHKMTGFNQWDEEWEVGDIANGTGNNEVTNERIRSKNYISVVPNTTYCFLERLTFYEYDADKTYLSTTGFIGINGVTPLQPSTFTTGANTHYIRFKTTKAYGTTYKHDICINLHWDGERDGEYEPYEVHEYALDSDVTLRGVPKLDADNKLYFDGDVYASDGSVERRYGIVDMGTLTWTSGFNGFYSEGIKSVAKIPADWATSNIICPKFITSKDSAMPSDSIAIYPSNNDTYKGFVIVKTTAYSDATTFKTAMSGVYLVYELATPTTESAEPYTNPQIVDDWGTEEYVIAEQSGVKMPVGHDTAYKPNLRAKLEMSPDSPSGGDGDYIVRQTSGTNEYVKLVIPTELPTNPSSDGNYILKATVSGGTTTLSWEVQS